MQQFLFDRDWQLRFPFLVRKPSGKATPEVVKQLPQPAAGDKTTQPSNTRR